MVQGTEKQKAKITTGVLSQGERMSRQGLVLPDRRKSGEMNSSRLVVLIDAGRQTPTGTDLPALWGQEEEEWCPWG